MLQCCNAAMDGVLVINKPVGLTSHDVVARARRILRERRVGHTGTLDPAATGVLPLVIGRATRLARFLSASDKSYDAVVVLGMASDTGDATGTPIGSPHQGPLPSRDAIDHALDEFRGTFMQKPPVYSAKKIDGKRSYALARLTRATDKGSDPLGDRGVALRPVAVTVEHLAIISVDGARVTLQVECSAGFYVRSLAHDLGDRLGVGAHLGALRRTRSGDYTLEEAMTLEAAERDPADAVRRIIPLARMLSSMPKIVLTPEGVRRAGHGRDLGDADVLRIADCGLRIESGLGNESAIQSALRNPRSAIPRFVRLVDPNGELVGIAEPAGAGGLLHPSVVLV